MQNEKTKKTKWALRLRLSIVILVILVASIIIAINSQNQKPTLTINYTVINIEIATTSQEKSRGLCCRKGLVKNSGMLFVYDKPGDYRFWMKDTLIPLDMYWIDSDKKIVHIEHSVQPSSYPKTFGTNIPSKYILETNAGFAKASSIKVGDTVKFDN